jgi:hypothetical protein
MGSALSSSDIMALQREEDKRRQQARQQHGTGSGLGLLFNKQVSHIMEVLGSNLGSDSVSGQDSQFFPSLIQSKMVQVVTVWTCIQKVLDSNLDWSISFNCSEFLCKCLKMGHDPVASSSLNLIIQSYHYSIIFVAETVSLHIKC